MKLYLLFLFFHRIINETKRGIGKASLENKEELANRTEQSMYEVKKMLINMD